MNSQGRKDAMTIGLKNVTHETKMLPPGSESS